MIKKNYFWTLQVIMMAVMLSMMLSSCDKDEHNSIIDENVTDSGEINTNRNEPTITGKVDGYDYVDLGLSVKWAVYNIGADAPEKYGSYFAWGETSEKESYSYENYSFFYRTSNSPINFTNIGNNISGTRYDVAYSRWGGAWRMPTNKDYDEIEEKCFSKWIVYKGVKGRLFTASNGNSIFFPAAGQKSIYDTEDLAEVEGYYWTSISGGVGFEGSACSFKFSFNDNEYYGGSAGWHHSRTAGMTIRAVNASSNTGGGFSNDGSGTSESLYFTNFNYTATQTSVTVKFYTNERASSATIKYGKNSASSSVSTTITNKEISATIKGLTKGTKYYVKCTARNSNESITSEEYPVITNY